MPDRLVTGLAAELDAVRPRHPRAARARYQRVRARRAPRRRLGGLAAAAAACGLALAALATLATGSPNPQVWTGTVAGQLQRLEEPTPPPASPAASPAVVGAPTPEHAPSQPAAPSQKQGERGQPTNDPHGKSDQRPSPSPRHQTGTSDSSQPGR